MYTLLKPSISKLARERHHLNQQLKQTAKSAGLNKADKISSHRLRASYIFMIQDSARDLNKTSSLARHRSADTTKNFYLQLSKKEQVETYKEAFKQEDS